MRIHQFRVYGEPQAAPKKEVMKFGNRMIPTDRDYRTRQNPITGQTEKYDVGYKKRWIQQVRTTVWTQMDQTGMAPYPKNHPLFMGCLFFLPKSPTNQLLLPSQPPDEDNLLYAIRNALKRTPKKKGRDTRFPQGVLFYEDDQIAGPWLPAGKLWATEENEPGVLITVVDALDLGALRTVFGEYTPNLLL